MNHTFNIEIAKQYGLESAIILENIAFWMIRNIVNKKNIYDNKVWIYNSINAWQKLFPYLTTAKIRRALKGLENKKILISGNYNKIAYDRTKWYTINDKILLNRHYNIQLDDNKPFAKITNGNAKITNGNDNTTNGNAQNNKPIPIINTINKPINKPSETNIVVKTYIDLLKEKNIVYIPQKYEYSAFYKQQKLYTDSGVTIHDINENMKAWINAKLGAWCGYKLSNFWGDIVKIQDHMNSKQYKQKKNMDIANQKGREEYEKRKRTRENA